MSKLVMGLCVLLLTFFTAGCALEKSIDAATDIGRAVATKVITTAPPLSSLAAGVQADITNPQYRVFAAVVNGFLLEVGLVGIDIDSTLSGQGAGPGTALTDEARQAIRDQLGDDVADSVIRIIEEMIREANKPDMAPPVPVTQPAGA